jgi:hypothetical protein
MAVRSSGRIARSVAAALVALAAAGCGTTGTFGAVGTAPARWSAKVGPALSNGLEKKSAAAVDKIAAALFTTTTSVHVTGAYHDREYGTIRVDIRLRRTSSAGTFRSSKGSFQFVLIGTTWYMKADERFLRTFGGPAASRLAGRWLKSSKNRPGDLDGFTLASLLADDGKSGSPLAGVRRSTVHGRKAVVITERDGTVLSIANVGRPYLLRIEDAGADGGWMEFSEYGAAFRITAPSNPIVTD